MQELKKNRDRAKSIMKCAFACSACVYLNLSTKLYIYRNAGGREGHCRLGHAFNAAALEQIKTSAYKK